MKILTLNTIKSDPKETLSVCTLKYTSPKYGLPGSRPFIHPAVYAQYAIAGFLVKKEYAKDS